MQKIELLAPGGDVNALKAAIYAGANAIYCGLDKFNARNRAKNISFDELKGIIHLAHQHNCKVFLTLNIIVVDQEIPALFKLLNKLVNTQIDGIIVQDLGVFFLISKYFKSLPIHASTQLTTHNEGQIHFLKKINATRVNLCRELNIEEIKQLSKIGFENDILTEVFVHGSYCLSFSGACYMSSVQSGKSGNRGQCSQPCRDKYKSATNKNDYPLNLKDNSAFFDIKKLIDAGVYSFKIEGRIKDFEYVHTVVGTWNKQIKSVLNHNEILADNLDLYKVFNRDFSNGFLQGKIGKDLFIDHPMWHFGEKSAKKNNKEENHDLKEQSRQNLQKEIDKLSIKQIPINITVSGEYNQFLKLSISTPEKKFDLYSECKLEEKGQEALSYELLFEKLKAVNETNYFIEQLNYQNNNNLYLPFNEITSLKKRIIYLLNDSTDFILPVEMPVLNKTQAASSKTNLVVSISSVNDLIHCSDSAAEIHFQLPDCLSNDLNELLEIFTNNKKLTPCFPSILIGNDYANAVKLLHQTCPHQIVTNNTGIAYEAFLLGIPWIAGPNLNLTNSYSLLCLKEIFNCSGAFISNEMNKRQMRGIKKPDDFKLYYSIFHPIEMMTSRACLFSQTIGCEKDELDQNCIQECEKSTSIINLKGNKYFIKKSKGKYHRIYNDKHYLNLEVISDFPGLYSSFSINLSDIKTDTAFALNKTQLIKHFENFISGNSNSKQKLNESIQPTTNRQYVKGI